MTILLATDAWRPQTNGVVRALDATVRCLRERGRSVHVISPDQFCTVPCPSYPSIRLAVTGYKAFARRLDLLLPEIEHVHIATEGPIASLTQRWCLQHGLAFTTSFHTRLADYIAMRSSIRAAWIWRFVTRFHQRAERTMAATERLAQELNERGIERAHHWPLGVDSSCFTLDGPRHMEIERLPGPVRLYVGRVAIEKNLDALLALDQPGTTVVVGDGPDLAKLSARYPRARFLGPRYGSELAALYRSADVFVFPSRSETLGLVMLEALACGTPVAAYPVPGPLDVVGIHGRGIHGGQHRIGALHQDLGAAIELARQADPAACVAEARRYDWHACTQRFVDGLVPIRPGRAPRLPHRRAMPDQRLEPAPSLAAADGRPSWERPTGTVRAQSAFAPYRNGIPQRASARHHSGTRNRAIPGTRSTPMCSPWLAMRRRGVWC